MGYVGLKCHYYSGEYLRQCIKKNYNTSTQSLNDNRHLYQYFGNSENYNKTTKTPDYNSN